MECVIRELSYADRAIWAEMRAALWPDEPAENHLRWIDTILKSGEWGFVAQAPDSRAVGFAEVSIRKFANACESAPVPFLEGIWVHEDFRRRGIGARLIAHVEAFLVRRGFAEIGSDALIANLGSHAAHKAWGFQERERIVCFCKRLDARPDGSTV